MPPKKQAKPNGFVLFAQELMKQHGRKYGSLKEACDGAAPMWARMGKDQKKPYDDRAKAMKGTAQKYTSDGLDVAALTEEQRMKNMEEESSRQFMRNLLTKAHQNHVLDKEVFFLIHCNIFCYYSNSNRYWPAEIGVAALTLKNGVQPDNIFHSMIAPGQLPIGYKFEAKQHSDETHLINIPTDDEPEDNQADVYADLRAFIERNKTPGGKYPVLYAEKKYVQMIQRILDVWMQSYDTGDSEPLKVYELQVMFYYLRNTVAGDIAWTSVTFSDRELEKDVFAYVQELACPFHATSSQPVFCSRSAVLRYAHVICDNCCGDLNIEFILGQHVPLNSRIPDSSGSVTTSRKSKKSSRSTFNSRRGFDSDFDTDSNADTWDTESLASISTVSTINCNLDDASFPALGGRNSSSAYSNSKGSDSTFNSSATGSYLSATMKSSLPSAFEKTFGTISINSDSPRSIGRGYRAKRVGVDSDASSIVGASSSESDFPRLGARGRGFLFKKIDKAPGAPSQ